MILIFIADYSTTIEIVYWCEIGTIPIINRVPYFDVSAACGVATNKYLFIFEINILAVATFAPVQPINVSYKMAVIKIWVMYRFGVAA
jgi:hypothetical protein